PWYKCLFSLYCLKKNAGEAVDEIKSFFVRYMEDLEKEALQHCGQDAECISKYKLKKGFSLALHLQPGLGLPSLAIEKLTGWSFLDTVADYTVEHPFEALATVLFLVSIPFTGGRQEWPEPPGSERRKVYSEVWERRGLLIWVVG